MYKKFFKDNLQVRFDVISDLTSNHPLLYKTNKQAAAKLGISVRQVQRIKSQFDGSLDSLKHLNTLSNKHIKFSNTLLDDIIFTVRSWNRSLEDAGFNHLLYSHAYKKILDLFSISMSYTYFRNLCINNNITSSRICRNLTNNTFHLPSKVNQSLAHGFEWQADGTFDFTIISSNLSLCMHLIVDAASNTIISGFLDTQETTHGYLNAFKLAFEKYGIPMQAATDKRPSFSDNSLDDNRIVIMKEIFDDLGIALRLTSNPRSKNKVESKNFVVKDHIMKELALLNASTIEEANALLPDVIDKVNSYLSNQIDDDNNVLRDLPVDYDFDIKFSSQYQRTTQANCSISLDNIKYVAVNANTSKIVNYKRGAKITIYKNYKRELFVIRNNAKCMLIKATKENTSDFILENQKKIKRVITNDNYTVNFNKQKWHFINQDGVAQKFNKGDEVILYYKSVDGANTPLIAAINGANYKTCKGNVESDDKHEILTLTSHDSSVVINNNIYNFVDINRNIISFKDCEVYVTVKNNIPTAAIMNSKMYKMINASI